MAIAGRNGAHNSYCKSTACVILLILPCATLIRLLPELLTSDRHIILQPSVNKSLRSILATETITADTPFTRSSAASTRSSNIMLTSTTTEEVSEARSITGTYTAPLSPAAMSSVGVHTHLKQLQPSVSPVATQCPLENAVVSVPLLTSEPLSDAVNISGSVRLSGTQWIKLKKAIDCWASLTHGRWVRDMKPCGLSSWGVRNSGACNVSAQAFRWLVSDCPEPWEDFSPALMHSALRGDQLVIVGDSLSGEHCASISRMADLERRSHAMMCVRNDYLTIDRPHCSRNIDSHTIDEWTNGLPINNATIVVLNRGAHYAPDDTVISSLHATIAWLRFHRPQALIIYRTTVPGHPNCVNATGPFSEYPAQLRLSLAGSIGYPYNWGTFPRQNARIRQMLDEYYPGVLYLDVEPATSLRPDMHATANDCLHYNYGKMKATPIDHWTIALFNVLRLVRRFASIEVQHNPASTMIHTAIPSAQPLRKEPSRVPGSAIIFTTTSQSHDFVSVLYEPWEHATGCYAGKFGYEMKAYNASHMAAVFAAVPQLDVPSSLRAHMWRVPTLVHLMQHRRDVEFLIYRDLDAAIQNHSFSIGQFASYVAVQMRQSRCDVILSDHGTDLNTGFIVIRTGSAAAIEYLAEWWLSIQLLHFNTSWTEDQGPSQNAVMRILSRKLGYPYADECARRALAEPFDRGEAGNRCYGKWMTAAGFTQHNRAIDGFCFPSARGSEPTAFHQHASDSMTRWVLHGRAPAFRTELSRRYGGPRCVGNSSLS